jgi:hypothetical protein
MKDLQKLYHFNDSGGANLTMSFCTKRSLYILINLSSHFLAHPALLPSLHQLPVEGISHAQLILQTSRPYFRSELFWDEFLDKIG